MPLPRALPVKPKATAQDVKRAAAVGDSVVAYFLKHGKFPTSQEDIKSQ